MKDYHWSFCPTAIEEAWRLVSNFNAKYSMTPNVTLQFTNEDATVLSNEYLFKLKTKLNVCKTDSFKCKC